MAVTGYIAANTPAHNKVPALPRAPLRVQLEEEGRFNGHSLEVGNLVKCTTCRQVNRLRASRAWVSQPCPGPPAPGHGGGHHIRVTRGLTFCSKCGFWEHPGRESKGLKDTCSGKATGFRRRIRDRLNKPIPQAPYELQKWPDGSDLGGQKRKPEAASVGPRAKWSRRQAAPGSAQGQQGGGTLVNSDRISRVYRRVLERTEGT